MSMTQVMHVNATRILIEYLFCLLYFTGLSLSLRSNPNAFSQIQHHCMHSNLTDSEPVQRPDVYTQRLRPSFSGSSSLPNSHCLH